ncbi:MAG: hypothetical protein E7573_11420 [Ruminococcaceae bacterium]|nr:hypothetical protein [Oscillospiraceae bacterium]
MKAVVMCGGVGSRLKPVTETQPKPLVKILNRPVLDIVIEKLIESGINDICLSLGFMSDEIINYIENSKYDADIKFAKEKIPLGTAGGVKNCIGKTDEDVIVVSGDNVFDFDLKKVVDYHFETDADITVCGIEVNDPREYGVILRDADGSVEAFIEKPTWEQAQSFLVNTGIYIFKGNLLEMIPENTFYDFANDLFPSIFRSDMRFMCYQCEGFWGDMGEFPAMLEVTADILNGKYKNFNFSGKFYGEDVHTDDGSVIYAPCLLSDDTSIGKGASIGPYTVIGRKSVIGSGCVIEKSILGEGVTISDNCDIKSCIACDNVRIDDNCYIDENTVLAYGCMIGRFSKLLSGCKIWPGRRIAPESVISKDMFYETPEKIDFDVFGVSGKINSVLTLSDAVKLGHAVAGLSNINKIGIGHDGKEFTSDYKNVYLAGMRCCGVTVYDFDEMMKIQSYFYSAYCSLDAFIYISADGDIINFSFYGKRGMPLTSSQARSINNNFRFSSFNFCEPEKYKDTFNMSLFSTVYKTYFSKLCGDTRFPFTVIIETENKFMKDMLEDIFRKKNEIKYSRCLQILINYNGTELYLVENDNFYSTQRLFVLLCELEFASGKDIIIPEDAPSIIEEKALMYDRKVFRIFESDNSVHDFDSDIILKSLWCFDPLFMVAKLFSIMAQTGDEIEKLLHYQEDFTMRKSIIEIDEDAGNIRELIMSAGAVKNKNDAYYTLSNRKGKARIRQMGNSNRIRVLAEAHDMETAKELSVFVAEKIKNSNIDKGKQK